MSVRGGLTALLAAITYGIQPYGGHNMGWTNPWVLAGLIGGTAALIAFCVYEMRIDEPMFDMSLFRIKAFSSGNSCWAARVGEPRRAAVHAHHLASGHLASAAWIQL